MSSAVRSTSVTYPARPRLLCLWAFLDWPASCCVGMAAAEEDEEVVTLQSSDGQNYTVSRAAAFLSETIQHLVSPS